MNKDIILQVENLNVIFDSEKIIDNLSFNLKDKENLVIVGPNGAGKTVLLRALLGVIPYDGKIKWKDGVKIGYVPQRFFPPNEIPLSVEEFFSFKKVDLEKVKKYLNSVGMDNGISFLKKQLGDLSAGQFQRIMIAWTLVDEPDVLLFDEPTTGIDIGGEETIYNLLKKIEKEINLTIILITHDLNVVYKLADSVLCLNKKTICYGVPNDVLSSENVDKLYGGEVKFYYHQHD